ncbi:DUF2721 domain-containing protein [Hymenobacter caeli]|uniref:Threonine/homoserine/homoserine lactone efflux protein n=1 Tax=Hymenobacter caeli TaxID=2735894 RepID=A0ABX2FVM2_9BACT|nr:DUF2721 domain-containing protein [Hymenobacter caeli]NRT21241.1 threonine/homoserine/homoserine lactone efflux protein [Hymenobacter caeli]
MPVPITFLRDVPGALAAFSAMVTPAILVSACGALVLTTSQRLSRSLERVRAVAAALRSLRDAAAPAADEHGYLTQQLLFAARRAKLLQKAMTVLYLALGTFVGTIVVIGAIEALALTAAWLLTGLALAGSGMFFYASVLLIQESRVALRDVGSETDYLVQHNPLA